MKPLIAIPHWRAPTWERTALYLDRLEENGARCRMVDTRRLPEGAQGLLLMGGVDVDAALYGQQRGPHTEKPNKERDTQELKLLYAALERDIPVLAVCRGHQLLNVAFGGSLVQHLDGAGHAADAGGGSAWHDVTLTGEGLLAAAYGAGAVLRVNSRHHQGLRKENLGAGLTVAAVSPDGWVEAIQSTAHRWVAGVQWHPERTEMVGESGPLFRAFIDACAAG
jgi:putative glutamine amidotransferase